MKRLVVFRFSAMGDVAMTVPILYSLAIQNPELQITIVSRAKFHAFFDKLPANVSFMEADLYGKHKGVKGLYRLFKELRHQKFDAVADLHGVIRTFFLRFCFRLTGVRVEHIDKGRKEKKALTRENNKIYRPLKTTFERYVTVLKKLGWDIDLNFTSIFYSEQPDKSQYLSYTGEKGNDYWIGIAPFAKHIGKMYPLPLMEQVISQLCQEKSTRILLFGGGQQEIDILAQWEKKYSNTISLAGKLKLNGELALISQLDVMVSMDSANMHMASLVNTPVISIWGATHPWGGFLGWNQSLENVIQTNLCCRPCSIFGQKVCLGKEYACLNKISPESILDRIHKLRN